ncbi:MAG: hypothetical protein ACM3KF_01005 [Acidobacteriota bacterium]
MSGEYRALSIDARLLADAQDYYASYGYVDTPTPWLVGEAAYRATLPPDHEGLEWQSPVGGYHVGSAEQGFMQLMADDMPIPERAQSTSPCYRGEPVYDELHWPYFYKLELYNADVSDASLAEMITCARGLFTQLGIPTRIIQTGERAYDIETATTHIELGSYGVRTFQGHEWLYGTGLALPRAMQAQSRE